MEQKHFYKSFCARCLTLLVLALLSVSNAWGADPTPITTTFGSTIPSGWTVTPNSGHASGYLKLKKGNTIETSDITTLIPEGNVLDSDVMLNISCGTFGSWNGSKKVTITAEILDEGGVVLSTSSFTKESLGNSESTYVADDYPIQLTKPSDVSKISKLKISFDIPNSSDVLRVKYVKLLYLYTEGGATAKKLQSIAVSGTPAKTTYKIGINLILQD